MRRIYLYLGCILVMLVIGCSSAAEYRYSYDEHGNLVTMRRDSDRDGDVDEIWHYVYDNRGWRIREELDSNADGRINQITTYNYDSNGNKVSEERDMDGDGEAEQVCTWQPPCRRPFNTCQQPLCR